MHEPTQLSLLDEKSPPKQAREVEYIPPTLAEIDQYVHKVCYQLGKRNGASGSDTDTIRGFAGFIQAIISMTTNQLNRKGQHVT